MGMRNAFSKMLSFATRPWSRNGHAAPSPAEKQEAARALTDERGAGYKPSLAGQLFWSASSDTPDLPRMLQDAEAMLAHPRVQWPLLQYRSGIHNCDFEVEDASSPEVGEFALSELKAFWRRDIHAAQRAVPYGRGPGELVYTQQDGLLRLDHLRAFHPLDGAPLTRQGQYAGVRVHGMRSKSGEAGDLWGPTWLPAKAWWHAHDLRYSRWYGWPHLYPAWRPWRRLAGRDGGEDIVDGAVYRFAIAPPIGRYPQEDQVPISGSQETRFASNAQKMREMLEYLKSGGVVAMSSRRDENGNLVWDVEWPKGVLDVSGLIVYTDNLEKAISFGLGVPPELSEAAEVGSGYSGRSIPLEAFLAIMQACADQLVASWLWQVGLPLCVWNFGPGAWVRIRAKNILKQRREEQQNAGGAGGAKGQGQPEAGGGQGDGNWRPHTGERGGQGWKDSAGNVVYGERPGQQFATAHAPAEGITIAGRKYAPGQSVPAQELAKAAPEQLALLRFGWAAYQGPKGGKGWKNDQTGKVVYQEKKPGEKKAAVPKPAPGEKKAAKDKPTVEGAKAQIQEMLAKGTVGPEDAKALAKNLTQMTVAQLTELKKVLGLKASGVKAELAKKLAEKALALAPAKKVKVPSPAPAAPAKGLSWKSTAEDEEELELQLAEEQKAPKEKFTYPAGYNPPTMGSLWNKPNELLPPESRPLVSAAQAKAMEAYSGDDHGDFNQPLWKGKQPEGAFAGMHARLQQAFAAAKPFAEPVRVRRGLEFYGDDLEKYLKQFHDAGVGGTLKLKGYQSTSTLEDGADAFTGGNVQLSIKATHGLDLKPYSENAGEHELLLNHNAEFRVRGITRKGSKWLIELTQLRPGEAGPDPAVASQPTATPATKPTTGHPLPDSPEALTHTSSLGGSTGAWLVKDASGNKYVHKKGASPAHLREEAAADSAYRALGLAVPEHKLYETKMGPVKLAKYLEGAKPLGKYLQTASPEKAAAIKKAVQQGFVADALLGNWDVIGLESDNVLVGPDGVPHRVDNGGSLRYRAQGALKKPEQFGDEVAEIDTLRDPKLNPSAAEVFAGISDAEIRGQVAAIQSKRAALLAAMPPSLQVPLARRLDWLVKKYPPTASVAPTTPTAPAAPPAKGDITQKHWYKQVLQDKEKKP